jgi:hypothetical protein
VTVIYSLFEANFSIQLLQENGKNANVLTTNVASVQSQQQFVDSYFNSVNVTSGVVKFFKVVLSGKKFH